MGRCKNMFLRKGCAPEESVLCAGYHLDSNFRAIPDKADESVIVRTVPLTRKQVTPFFKAHISFRFDSL